MTEISIDKKKSFISMSSRAKFLVILFIIAIVLEVVATVSNLSQMKLLGDMAEGLTVSDEAIASSDGIKAIIALAQMVLILVTGIVFLRWFYRTHANLKALEVEGLKYTPGWAVGYFFIPIFNIIGPFLVAVEMWKASFSVSTKVEDWKKMKTPGPVSAWWIFYIVAGVAGSYAGIKATQVDVMIDGLILSTQMEMVSSVLWVVSTIFAITMVKSITAVQEEKAKAFSLRDTGVGMGGFIAESTSDITGDSAGDDRQ